MTKRLLYLASPYSHHDPNVRQERYHAACQAAATLLHLGLPVFSPIAHSHALTTQFDAPTTWQVWRPVDFGILVACSDLLVLRLDGWHASIGVTEEINQADRQGIPIHYAWPDEVETVGKRIVRSS